MRQFHKGQWVFWKDPEGKTSGLYRVSNPNKEYNAEATEQSIAQFDDRMIAIQSLCGSEAEVYAQELESPSLRVIFRVEQDEVSAHVFALFPDENPNGQQGIVLYYQSGDSHYAGDFNGCINASVPAQPQDYTPLLQELQSVGFGNLRIITYRDWKRGKIDRLARRLAQRDLMEQNDQLLHQLYYQDGNLREEYRDDFSESVRFYTSSLALLCAFEEG